MVQSPHTVFNEFAKKGKYGYEPQRLPKQQEKKKKIKENADSDTNAFFFRYNEEMFQG